MFSFIWNLVFIKRNIGQQGTAGTEKHSASNTPHVKQPVSQRDELGGEYFFFFFPNKIKTSQPLLQLGTRH